MSPVARIIGVNANVNEQEIAGESASGINGYFNEQHAFVKRPGLGLEFELTSPGGISGIYDWVDQNQAMVTVYDGSIWRINALGPTLLSSSSVRNGGLKATFDGNGTKLWIASGGKMINVEATTPAGGAVYLPAYDLVVPVYNALSGVSSFVAGIPIGSTAFSLASPANMPTVFPFDAVMYTGDTPAAALLNRTGESVSVTGIVGDVATIAVATTVEYLATDRLIGPVTYAVAAPPNNVTHVVYYDGYIICNQIGSGDAWYNDGPALDASDAANDLWTGQRFVGSQYKPDNIIAIYSWYHELFFFGNRSIEVYYNDGSTPFSKVEGSQLDVGMISPYSAVTYNNIPYFMTSERVICMYNGRQTIPISDKIQRVIDNYSVADDVVASTITDNGQNFLLYTFPTQNESWAYNLGSKSWSKWMGPDLTGAVDIGVSTTILDTSFNTSNKVAKLGWASTVSNLTFTTGAAWSNESNVVGPPNVFGSMVSAATLSTSSSLSSDWLRMTTTLAAEDANWTVLGVEARVYFLNDTNSGGQLLGDGILGDVGGFPAYEAATSATTYVIDSSEAVLTGNAIVSGLSLTVATPSTSSRQAYISYGGVTSQWGINMNPGDLLNLGFKWRTVAIGLNLDTLKVSAMSIVVYYQNGSYAISTGGTWAGSADKANIYSFSSSKYSDELTSSGGVPVKSPITVVLESPPLTYGTLRKKYSAKLAIRFRTKSHAIRMYIKDNFGVYGNAVSIPANTGSWTRRNLGIYKVRQYKFIHKMDSAFSFIEIEEDVTALQ